MKINFKRDWIEDFKKRTEVNGPWSNWELFNMAYETEKILSVPDFLGLQAPKFLPNLTPLQHQIEVAETVIEKMNGKAILADEVGLGKTIEAGLILKEYMIRGLVKKALILVPSSLISQWVQELNQKFFIPAVGHRKSYVIEQCDVVVTSIDTAKREPHRKAIMEQEYDFIIIDEAHRLKNNKTKNYEFVQNLKKRFCLLLTATPIQNEVYEIFNLISLLKPGHLGNVEEFQEKYKAKKQSLENDEKLKELVSKVMVRNRRGDTGIEWTKRNVQTINIDFNEQEKELYETINALRKNPHVPLNSAFSMITLQREACSSREAVFFTIQKMAEKFRENEVFVSLIETIAQKINKIEKNSKAEKVYELIEKKNEKFIIFTEYRATQMYLQWYLQKKGLKVVTFNGKFKRSKRDWMRQLFEEHAQVLIATEAGGEGINLQFCNNVINYDLPWNPMRLEQRIGRVHRLGQKEDVNIYNFAINETIEEHVLELLYKKIGLFEKVIGELDDILSKLEIKNIEEMIKDIIENSSSEGEIKIKMDNLQSYINMQQNIKEVAQ